MGFKSKLLNLKDCAINSMIYNTYYNKSIDEKLVYLESRDGLDFTGNIFRIVEELSTGEYGDLKIYVHAKPSVVDKIKNYQKNYDLKIDKIITKEATATEILERAKYIFTDSGIRPKYVKREGQIFVNTWHGTPLKVMGKDNTAEEHRLGNVQHPFLSSDYLLYPNDYMKEKMIDAYMIEKIFTGKILLEGYPRNSVFFSDSYLKEKLGFDNKEIFVYMPTYRGILMDRDSEGQKDDVESFLAELDLKLNDNQLLFAKLHVLNESNIDFDKFSHIMAFPEGYDIYDVLNMADCLITDYSSVFFDYANACRKIIIFNYDEKDYLEYRGTYFPIDDLPFPKVQNIDGLVDELNYPKDYDDSEFLKKFCTYDNPNAAKRICQHIFNDNDICKVEKITNSKPNVLIFAGSLYDDDITSLLFKLLEKDCLEYNFFITYKQWDENISLNHEKIFKSIPSNVEVLPIRFNLTPTVYEKHELDKFHSSNGQTNISKNLSKLYKRSFEKQFNTIKWDRVIDFRGDDRDISLMFSSSNAQKSIWVHDGNTDEASSQIYNAFDEVCTISPDLIKSISGQMNIHVVDSLVNK